MALAPKFAHAFLVGSTRPAVHTIELYLDYICPFSKKLFLQFYTNVAPVLEQKYAGKVQVIFRHQIQPWHPSSTLVHEAALAVGLIAPEGFWDYSKALFDCQETYFDVCKLGKLNKKRMKGSVMNETRNQTYKRLSDLATSATGIPSDQVFSMLQISTGAQNSGNKVTNDLKVQIKEARQRSIHVSPTVLLNGTVDNSVSSRWNEQQWQEWLENNIV